MPTYTNKHTVAWHTYGLFLEHMRLLILHICSLKNLKVGLRAIYQTNRHTHKLNRTRLGWYEMAIILFLGIKGIKRAD